MAPHKYGCLLKLLCSLTKEIPTTIKAYDTFSVDIWYLTKAINIGALQAPLSSIKGHNPEWSKIYRCNICVRINPLRDCAEIT